MCKIQTHVKTMIIKSRLFLSTTDSIDSLSVPKTIQKFEHEFYYFSKCDLPSLMFNVESSEISDDDSSIEIV